MSDTIFSTIHGSHLYGMAHAGSDTDIFRVVRSSSQKAKHIVGDTDTVEMPLDVFLRRIREGSHQSVEALFSPVKEWNLGYEYLRPMFDSYFVAGPEVFSAYRRTITSFCYGDYKKRRHAVRLRGNLQGLQESGRFNPVMSDSDIARADFLARHYEGDVLREILLEQW